MSLELLSRVFLPAALALMMMGLGTSLSLRQFRLTLVRPLGLVLGLLGQLLLLPLVAFLLAWSLSLSTVAAMGLVIIACCPGGIASNVVTFALRGDTALSITLTSLSTFASLLTIPAYLTLALHWFAPGSAGYANYPLAPSVLGLAALILIPAGLGLALSVHRPALGARVEALARRLSFPFLCLVMLVVIGSQWSLLAEHLLDTALPVLLFAVLMTSLGLGLGTLARLDARVRRTLAIEIALQNTTVALLIALTYFEEPGFALVPGAYGVMMFMALALLLPRLRPLAESEHL